MLQRFFAFRYFFASALHPLIKNSGKMNRGKAREYRIFRTFKKGADAEISPKKPAKKP
jgi:hypothetical protein